MKVSFNVLTAPWIPVINAEGGREELGILSLLERAHELQSVSDASPLVEFSLHRLLFVFLTDALRPADTADLIDLLDAGRFDMDLIREYVSLCESEGVSFDLFDEERPFLQTPYKAEWDRESKPVTVLDCTIPSGNNHTHFDHRKGSTVSIPSAAAARLLPTVQLFCTAGAQGYPSGVNGAPPFYMIIQEDNLFRTLVCGLGTEDDTGNLDDPLPLWRYKDVVESKKVISDTSWLMGMLFPARRVLLIPDENGETISAVYLSQGMNYTNAENWDDPNASYRVNEKGRFPIRPNRERAVWRNLAEMLDIQGKTAAKILPRYEVLCPEKNAAMLAMYGVQTEQASYLGIARHAFEAPRLLASTPERVETLKSSIKAAEDLEYGLSDALKSAEVIPQWGISQARQEFFDECEKLIWQFCAQDLSAEVADMKEAYLNWCAQISAAAEKAYAHVIESCRLGGKSLASVAKNTYKLRKKEKEIREVVGT